MEKPFIVLIVAFVFIYETAAVQRDHEMCCHSCSSKYSTSKEMESACLRGCRLYGMIFLAHDPSVERGEIAGLCAKSCLGAEAADACSAGCSQQERIFRERQVGALSAKLAVMHGLSEAPQVDSPAPYHSRMFNRLPVAAASAPVHAHAWLRAVSIRVRPLPNGPDGRPRYWVEVSERIIPLQLTPLQLGSAHHGLVHEARLPRLAFEARLSPRARAGIRWAACALLIMSIVGLLWLCCSIFPTAPKVRVLRLQKVLLKQPLTSIQSGDLVGIGAGPEDKKPLLIPDAAAAIDEKPRVEAV